MLPSPGLLLGALLLLAPAAAANAQQGGAAAPDPNLEFPTRMHSMQREGYTISALVTHHAAPQAFRHGIALFPGHPGILRLREEAGQLHFELRGNFLVRSRRQWLDDDILVAVVDAPSDQWATFSQQWRETPRYGADIAALLGDVSARYRVADWTFVGTSEGSLSAFHAARMNPGLARRLILTSSVFTSSRNGPGLSAMDFGALPPATLWVHHENDPCRYTSYRDAREFSTKSGKPLLTMRGGGPERGGPCEPFSAHGYVGIERQAVRAMLEWIRRGSTPAAEPPRAKPVTEAPPPA